MTKYSTPTPWMRFTALDCKHQGHGFHELSNCRIVVWIYYNSLWEFIIIAQGNYSVGWWLAMNNQKNCNWNVLQFCSGALHPGALKHEMQCLLNLVDSHINYCESSILIHHTSTSPLNRDRLNREVVRDEISKCTFPKSKRKRRNQFSYKTKTVSCYWLQLKVTLVHSLSTNQ